MSPVDVECVAVGSSEAVVDAGFNLEVFVVVLTSVSSCESLNSVRTYVRLVCEWGHRDAAIDGLCGSLPDLLGMTRSNSVSGCCECRISS